MDIIDTNMENVKFLQLKKWKDLNFKDKIKILMDEINNITLFDIEIKSQDLEELDRYNQMINDIFSEAIKELYKLSHKYEKDNRWGILEEYQNLLIDLNFILNKLNLIVFCDNKTGYIAYLLEKILNNLILELNNLKDFEIYKKEQKSGTSQLRKLKQNINTFFKKFNNFKEYDVFTNTNKEKYKSKKIFNFRIFKKILS